MELAEQVLEKQQYRIMVIDDNELELKLYANALSSHFIMSFATSADKAWELLNRAPLPDAIILDIMISNEDGLAFCHRLKESSYFRDIPVVFLSSMAGPSVKAQAFELGGADFVSKPPNMGELVARLNRHIALHHKTKRLESLIFIDPLTHLPNAAKFHEILKQEWSRCARYWHHLSLILIRLQNLRIIEERYGKDELFAIIASIADDLCSVGARPGDLFASYTDDTFALLLSDCSTEGAKLKADEIKQRFEHPNFMAKHESSAKDIYCTIAFAVAAPAGGSNPQELIHTTESVLVDCTGDKQSKICHHQALLGVEGISS